MKKELVILERLPNSKDFKILDKITKKQVGLMLEAANGDGYELYASFNVPDNYEFPKTSRTSQEGWVIFNLYYELKI